jgi:hypothetical protein
MNRPAALLALLLPVLGHGAAADLWPSGVKRLEDGRVEYAYDLRPLKAGKVVLDLGPDEDAAAAFLRALPDSAQVVVNARGARTRLHAPGGLERAPLSASFSGVSPGPFLPSGPGEKPRAKDVPRLHPDAPHVLPSVELLLWHHRRMQDAAWAALQLNAHQGGPGVPMGRAALLQRVLVHSLQRSAAMQGDAREGARRLAARLAGAVEATSVPGPRPWRSDAELWARVQDEARWLAEPRPQFPAQPWVQWSAALGQLPTWDRAVEQPLENTREGAAAHLTFLAILERDPALQKAYDAQRRLRDALFGAPQTAHLEAYRQALGERTAQDALEDMSPFLGRLPREVAEGATTAPLFVSRHTPITRFLAQLQGPEQLHAQEELAVALLDERVSFPAGPEASWAQVKDAWTRPLLAADADPRLSVTSDYRTRLSRGFAALLGGHGEVQGGESWVVGGEGAADAGAAALRIRLMVPPHLELEPLPAVYAEAAAGWGRLAATLEAQGALRRVRGVGPGGARALALHAEALKMQALFGGLALAARVALGEEAPVSDAERRALREARTFLDGWRAHPDLRSDARSFLPVSAALGPDTFVHSGVLGVGRRELEARFEQPPEVEIRARSPEAFVADTRAVQRYQAPVLATGAVTVPRGSPLPPAELRAVANRERTRDAIEAALPGALVRSPRQVDDPR